MTTPPAGDASAGSFTAVARVGGIPAGEGRTFEVAGRLVAVFFDGERYHALDDLCPHMGASLGAGEVQEGVVACPWHAWRFSIRTGQWVDNPRLQVATYKVWEEEGRIWVELPDPPPVEKTEQVPLPPPGGCGGS